MMRGQEHNRELANVSSMACGAGEQLAREACSLAREEEETSRMAARDKQQAAATS